MGQTRWVLLCNPSQTKPNQMGLTMQSKPNQMGLTLQSKPIQTKPNQMGLAEAVVESVSACEPAAQPWLYRNILLTGGSMVFPGMRERLEQEVRTLAPDSMQVQVRVTPSPGLYPWQGGASLAKDPDLPQLYVTKEEYMEKGFQAYQHRFYL